MKVGEEHAWRGPGIQETPAPDPSALDNLKLQGAILFEYAKEYGFKGLKISPAVGALTLAAMASSVPGAKQEAIQETVVQTDIVDAPAELRLTGNGWSSLQLGAPGSYYLEKSQDNVGVSAEVKDMPKVGGGTVQDLLSPEFKTVVSSIFSDPESAIDGYVDLLSSEAKANFMENEATRTRNLLGLAGGAFVVSLLSMGKERRRRLADNSVKASLIVAGGSLVAGGAGYAAGAINAEHQRELWADSSPEPAPNERFTIMGTRGTAAEGVVASNPILQIATNEAVPGFKKNVERMKQATDRYVANAAASFLEQIHTIQPPREGEIMYIAVSDMHGNEAMTQLLKFMVNALNAQFGEHTVEFITASGDLTMNGSPAEKRYIVAFKATGDGSEDTESDDTPVVAIGGNHESDESNKETEEVGIIVPNQETKNVRGIDILGANDSDHNRLGTSTTYINEVSEAALGELVRKIAESDKPDIVLLHQAYAVMSFMKLDPLDQEQTMAFLAENGLDNKYFTTYRDDGVENVPASIIDFGHWHLTTTHKVLWNKDEETGKITWTLVRELNTAGGGDASPTINHFPLPTYPPLQNAGIELTYMNAETGLPTGFASLVFTAGAEFIPAPRTEIGLPGGIPGYDDQAKGANANSNKANRR